MYDVLLNTFVIIFAVNKVQCADDLLIRKDGSYKFDYSGPDSFHQSQANRNNVVRGKFGGRNPETGRVDQISYTAGPRGYRPRGDNVVRKYDLGQNPIGPIGSRDDPYYDPNEDPSYKFKFRTRTYERDEGADSRGDVRGRYSYIDDVGERHNVEYIAGSRTGFRVRTPFPDSNLRLYGRLFFNGRGKPLPRGRTSIQQGEDGSYRFISAGPDQRRVESSDASGYVTGSYTYLDDKGVQRTVNYEAGPEIGYRIIKSTPNFYPYRYPDLIPQESPFIGKDDDLFDTAASGPIKPVDNNIGGGTKPITSFPSDGSYDGFDNQFPSTTIKPGFGGSTTTRRPIGGGSFGGGAGSFDNGGFDSGADSLSGGSGGGLRPSYDDEDLDEDIGDLFDSKVPPSTTRRPNGGSTTSRPSTIRPGGRRPTRPTIRPTTSRPGISGGREDDYDDGSYKPDDGSYGKPIPRPTPAFDDGSYKPGGGGGRYKPTRPRPSYDYDNDFNDINDDFGLFGKPSTTRPFSTKPPLHVGISSAEDESRRPGGGDGFSTGGDITTSVGVSTNGDGGRGGSRRPFIGRHTIVTNIGDELFSVPPGVSVRAHVQAIDLLPLNAKILSPSEQYKSEVLNRDSANAESNNVPSNETTSTTEKEPSSTEPTIPSSTSSSKVS